MPFVSGNKNARRSDGMLRLIAAFKFVKALLLIAAGLGALKLLDPNAAERARRWVATIASTYDWHVVHKVLAQMTGQTPAKLEAFGVAAFLYAALFTTEGVGLWLGKRWAEYLTIIATLSFVPFEIYELTRSITAPRVAALIINLAVVAYLAYRVRHDRGASKEESHR